MRGRLVRLAVALGLAATADAAALAASDATASLGGLDAYVARAMKASDVPGLALAVVKDGRVVLAKGYGVRRVGQAPAVDPDTRFGIASNTKAFTCASLSILADEGRLSWDDPVTRHLPEFQMYDPWVTRELTVLDLVTHRAGLGLGQGDLMFWPATTFTRHEIVRGVRWLKPASSFRSRYAYNNVMYVVAGEVLAAASGRRFEDFVQERILAPLGMTRTATTAAAADANVAAPHLMLKGEQRPITPSGYENAAAAAALVSSASDMARWLRMLLECGAGVGLPPNESCVVKPESIRGMWTPRTVLPLREPPPGLEPLRAGFAAYGLGFGVRDHRGRKLVSHGGALPGYASRVALVPDERLGVAVLSNQEQNAPVDAVVHRVLDSYLGEPSPSVDWVSAFGRAAEEERSRAERVVAGKAAARRRDTRPSLPLAGYAGRYRDPWYGVATVGVEAGSLVLRMTRTPGMESELEHWQHDTFVARWRTPYMSDAQPSDAFVSFALGPDGAVERMALEPVSPAIDFSFDYRDLLFTPIGPERQAGP